MGLLTQDDVKDIEKELKDKKEKLSSLTEHIASVNKELESKEKDLEETETILRERQTIEKRLRRTIEDAENSQEQGRELEDSLVREAKEIKTALEELGEDPGTEAERKKLEQALDNIETQRADIRAKEDALEKAKQDAEDELSDLEESIDETKADKATLETDIEKVNEELENVTTAYNETKARVIELENDDTVARLNEQIAERRNHARSTFSNIERIKPLINNKNTGLEEVAKTADSDTNVFIADIEAELGMDENATSIMKSAISDIVQQNSSVVRAEQAFNLSRESIFNIAIAGISDKIKAACHKGHTSLVINQSEITGIHILVLNQLGYKVTHASTIADNGKVIPNVTIDWGFANEEGNS